MPNIGYVVLTKQWGSTTSNNMALPISFSTVFGGVGARYTTSGYSGINSITTNKVTVGYERSSFIAVGKQQWGVGKNADYSPNTSVSVNYPISFPNTVLSIIPTLTGSYANATIIYPKSYTVNNVVFCVDEWSGVTQTAKPMFITIGVQKQWGTSTSEKTKTFPIAFSSNCYSVLNIMNENSNRYENPYVLNVTTSSFKSGLSGVNYKMYWIAVGKQQLLRDVQWGYTSSATATYPIAFSVVYRGVGMRFGKSGYTGVHSVTTTTITFGYDGNAYFVTDKQCNGVLLQALLVL